MNEMNTNYVSYYPTKPIIKKMHDCRASKQPGFVVAGRQRGGTYALTSPSAFPWSHILGEIPVDCLKSKHAGKQPSLLLRGD